VRSLLNSAGWQNFLTLSAVYTLIVASASFITGVYAKEQVVLGVKSITKQYDDVGFYVNVLLELKRQEDPQAFIEACRRAQRLQGKNDAELCKE
jgi:hypothetical protein